MAFDFDQVFFLVVCLRSSETSVCGQSLSSRRQSLISLYSFIPAQIVSRKSSEILEVYLWWTNNPARDSEGGDTSIVPLYYRKLRHVRVCTELYPSWFLIVKRKHLKQNIIIQRVPETLNRTTRTRKNEKFQWLTFSLLSTHWSVVRVTDQVLWLWFTFTNWTNKTFCKRLESNKCLCVSGKLSLKGFKGRLLNVLEIL